MDTATSDPNPSAGLRKISVPIFIGLVVVYLAIIKIGGLLVDPELDPPKDRLLGADQVLWTLIIPLGVSLVFVCAAVLVLGWQRPVVIDDKPVQRWVGVVPLIFVVTILLGINYGDLADRGLKFTVALLIGTQIVGWAEEGMFRGIGVTTFRINGYSETRVALWSSVVFGAAHIVNLIGGDAGAVGQAVAVSFAGYFFYLIRRWSGSNILNSVLHGLFDFTIISAVAIMPEDDPGYVGGVFPLLAYIAVGIVVFVRRHRIEPEAASAVATG